MQKIRAAHFGAVLALFMAAAGCKSSSDAGGGSRPGATSGAATTATPSGTSTATGGNVAAGGKAALIDTGATEKAPDLYKARFETTKGAFTVEVHREWAPLGADRFYHLVKVGFFDEAAFFRCIKGFMVQFGIHGDPSVSAAWKSARIQDDPKGPQSNARGMVTFATSGPNSRTTQLFINYGNNAQLDGMGFTPFGRVTDGLEVVDALEGKYGEGAPGGMGPSQGRIQSEGNTYLRSDFPALDYVKKATIQ